MIFFKALAVFLGTVIGVGFFSLPFVSFKAGFFISVCYLFEMAFIAIAVHLMYAEVCVGTTKNLRLPGYAKEYLGQGWSKIALIVIIFSLFGSLIPYLIVGGEFLNSIFGPCFGYGPVFYAVLFFIAGAYLIFKGIKEISFIDVFLLFGIIAIVFILFFKSLAIIKIDNLKGFYPGFLFMPYGVILFSLWGSSVIPELKEIMSIFPGKRMRQNMIRVIFWGLIITTFIYFCFIFAVLGVSGDSTSKEAIAGLSPFLGKEIVFFGSVLGIICCFTSFIAIGLVLKKTFWHDFNVPKNVSWFIVCFIPFLLFLLGARDFIKIIGLTGAISIGLEAIIVVFLYKSFMKKRFNKKINPVLYFLVLIFLTGIALEIASFFS